MKREFLIFLTICAFTAAMVPRERRAVNTEETQQPDTQVKICATITPCAWSLYVPKTDILKETIINTYCICASNMQCVINENDSAVDAFVHRCRPVKNDNDKS